eukprot:TRINITY_DN551_c8_g1_i1.p1 TRINITY_DN551_c8_g1~~TRINITY_DN551_c8_g1_i1.p1  ORF type:complete len:2472 (+),score=596.83 TRINITY_DN551_c8_g1_i1:79-7494(+)
MPWCATGGATACAVTQWAGADLVAVALTTGAVAIYHGGALLQVLPGSPGMQAAALAWAQQGGLLFAARSRDLMRWGRDALAPPAPSAAFGAAGYACTSAGAPPQWRPLLATRLSGADCVDATQYAAAVGSGRGVCFFTTDIGRREALHAPPPVAAGRADIAEVRWTAAADAIAVRRAAAAEVEIWALEQRAPPEAADEEDQAPTEEQGPLAAALCQVLAHPAEVLGLAWSPCRDRALATACADGVARVWEECSGALRLAAANRSPAAATGCASVAWVDRADAQQEAGPGGDPDAPRSMFGVEPGDGAAGAAPLLAHADPAGTVRILAVEGLLAHPRGPVRAALRATAPSGLAGGRVVAAAGPPAAAGDHSMPPLSLHMLSACGRVDAVHLPQRDDSLVSVAAYGGTAGSIVCAAAHPALPLLLCLHASGSLALWMTGCSVASSPAAAGDRPALVAQCPLSCEPTAGCSICWAPDDDTAVAFVHTLQGVIPVIARGDHQVLVAAETAQVAHGAYTPQTPPTTPGQEPADAAWRTACPGGAGLPACWSLRALPPLAAGKGDTPVRDAGADTQPKKAKKAEAEQRAAPAPETDAKAALRAKYAHLLKAKQAGGAAQTDPAAAPQAAAPAAAPEPPADPLPPPLPADPTPLTMRCLACPDGLRILAAVTADGRVRLWGWGAGRGRRRQSGSTPQQQPLDQLQLSSPALQPAGRWATPDSDPSEWSAERLAQYLTHAGVPSSCVRRMKAQCVTGRVLFSLTEGDLLSEVGLQERSARMVIAAQRHLRVSAHLKEEQQCKGLSVGATGPLAELGPSEAAPAEAATLPGASPRWPQLLAEFSFRGLSGPATAAAVGTAFPGGAVAGTPGAARGRLAVMLASGGGLLAGCLIAGELGELRAERVADAAEKEQVSALLPVGACSFVAVGAEGRLLRYELSSSAPPRLVQTARSEFRHSGLSAARICPLHGASPTALALVLATADSVLALDPGLRRPPVPMSSAAEGYELGGAPACLAALGPGMVVAAHPNGLGTWALPDDGAVGFAVPYDPALVAHWLEQGDSAAAAGVLRQLLVALRRASRLARQGALARRCPNTLEAEGALAPPDAHASFAWGGDALDDGGPCESENALSPDEAAELAELIAQVRPPGLSPESSMRLLSLADMCTQQGQQGIDPFAQRFMLAAKLRRVQQRRAATGPLPWDDVVWALHSGASDAIVAPLAAMYGAGGWTWEEAVELRLPLWLRSTTALRAVSEEFARAAFLKRKDPADAALLYVALRKHTALASLIKQQGNERLSDFFLRDFDDESNRAAAGKNAFNLLSKGNVLYAAAFFLLAGRPDDAVGLIMQRLGDWVLAYYVLRLWEEHTLLGPLAQGFLEARLAEGSGSAADEVGEAAPWQRHLQLWLLGRQPEALEALWHIRGHASDVCDLAMHAVKHAPQLHQQADTLLPARRRVALHLAAMAQHTNAGHFGAALRSFREYCQHRERAATEDSREMRRAARRAQREQEAQRKALESGMLDFDSFGGFGGGGAAPAPGAAPGPDSGSESDDGGDRPFECPQVVAVRRWQLGVGLLTEHVEKAVAVLSAEVAAAAQARGSSTGAAEGDDSSPRPSQDRHWGRWAEMVAGARRVLRVCEEELALLPGAVAAAVHWGAAAQRRPLAVTLLQHALCPAAGLPSAALDIAAAAAQRLAGLRPGPPARADAAGQKLAEELLSLVLLTGSGLQSSRGRCAALTSCAAASLACLAWGTRDAPLLLALARAPPPADAGTGEGLEWLRGAVRQKGELEAAAAARWAGATRGAAADAGGGRSVTVLSTLLLHTVLFRLRCAAGRGDSPRTMCVYAAAVAAGRRALQGLHLELAAAAPEGAPRAAARAAGPCFAALAHFALLPAAARALRGLCRDELRTDLTGYAEPPHLPRALRRWAASVEAVVRNHATLEAAAQQVTPQGPQPHHGTGPARRASVHPAQSCAANEALFALSAGGWPAGDEDGEGTWQQAPEEVHRSRKGAVYDIAAHRTGSGALPALVACMARGVQELGGGHAGVGASPPPEAHERGRAAAEGGSHGRAHHRSISQGRAPTAEARAPHTPLLGEPVSGVKEGWAQAVAAADTELAASDGEQDAGTTPLMRARRGSMRRRPSQRLLRPDLLGASGSGHGPGAPNAAHGGGGVSTSTRRTLLAALHAAPPPGTESVDLDDVRPRRVAAHPTQPLYAAGGMDGTVHLFTPGASHALRSLRGQSPGAITGLGFAGAGTLGASSYCGKLMSWVLGRGTELAPAHVIQAHPGFCCDMAHLDAGGTLVATAGAGPKGADQLLIHDLLFSRWAAESSHAAISVGLPQSRDGSAFEARCLGSLAPHREEVVVAGKRGEVALYDLRQMRFPAAHRRVHDHSIRAMAVSPSGQLVAVGTSDGDVLLLSSRDLQVEASLPDQHPAKGMGINFDSGAARVSGVTALLWHPSESALYSGGADGRVCRRPVPPPAA